MHDVDWVEGGPGRARAASDALRGASGWEGELRERMDALSWDSIAGGHRRGRGLPGAAVTPGPKSSARTGAAVTPGPQSSARTGAAVTPGPKSSARTGAAVMPGPQSSARTGAGRPRSRRRGTG